MHHLTVPAQFKDLIFVSGEQAQTTSLLVAERFGKNHKDVLRAIANLECSAKFRASNIEESSYIDDKGREQKMYVLNKDGFYKLAMGFTGEAATAWQELFLDAFNWMQDELKRLLTEEANRKYNLGLVEGASRGITDTRREAALIVEAGAQEASRVEAKSYHRWEQERGRKEAAQAENRELRKENQRLQKAIDKLKQRK
jgi:Rha family phage regulatory protein